MIVHTKPHIVEDTEFPESGGRRQTYAVVCSCGRTEHASRALAEDALRDQHPIDPSLLVIQDLRKKIERARKVLKKWKPFGYENSEVKDSLGMALDFSGRAPWADPPPADTNCVTGQPYAFTALDWWSANGKPMVGVRETIPADMWEPYDLKDCVVTVDGAFYKILAVEAFAISRAPDRPYRRNIGLMVEPVDVG